MRTLIHAHKQHPCPHLVCDLLLFEGREERPLGEEGQAETSVGLVLGAARRTTCACVHVRVRTCVRVCVCVCAHVCVVCSVCMRAL